MTIRLKQTLKRGSGDGDSIDAAAIELKQSEEQREREEVTARFMRCKSGGWF